MREMREMREMPGLPSFGEFRLHLGRNLTPGGERSRL